MEFDHRIVSDQCGRLLMFYRLSVFDFCNIPDNF